MRTPFIDRWLGRLEEAKAHSGELRDELMAAMSAGRAHEYMPLAGQSAGAVHDILPAAEIVRNMVADAEEILRQVNQ